MESLANRTASSQRHEVALVEIKVTLSVPLTLSLSSGPRYQNAENVSDERRSVSIPLNLPRFIAEALVLRGRFWKRARARACVLKGELVCSLFFNAEQR